MKKTIRIIIPILLAISIILCTAWYLMIYDRDFTRDMLIQGARFFESNGKHETASWLYNLAYQQAAENDDVAIELAQQYKSNGNYTKAEYILTSAISEGGSAELYMELCKTFLEQDKILDAVKLLDAACREDSTVPQDVKETLISLRPAAPTVSPAPGLYSQYISVSLSTQNGILYASSNGVYPSVQTDVYTKPIPLTSGENSIYAVAASNNGLVSPLAIFGYTVGGVIEEVHFTDSAIERQVREILNVSSDTVLLSSDLWRITEFAVPDDAKDYSDLRHFKNLEELTVYAGVSGQLHVISGASKLTTLTVINTPVSAEELTVIGALPTLKKLTLQGCSLSTTAGLDKAAKLTYLNLSENTIRNIHALAVMKDLQECYLQRNAIQELSALASLPALTVLDVSYNAISSLSTVYSVNSLTTLIADGNKIAALESIDQLQNLTELSLSYNQLTDISPLSTCEKLQKLTVSNNALTSVSVLSKLPALSHLDFSYNQVRTLPSFSTSCVLVSIDGSHNLLSDLSALRGLKRLNTVIMDYNEKISSVSKLAECPVLIKVSVFGTKVKDVSKLTEQSIVVYYNPS